MSDITPNPETRIALFQRKEVRRTIHNNEWWFVISDVITALTDSVDPSQYLKRIRQRDPQLNGAFKGGVQLVPPLALEFSTAGGPQMILCWNTEGIFRLIQSIPSPKAEPFKRWLARVGYEHCPPRIGKEERSPGCHSRELSGADAVGEENQTIGWGYETAQEGLTNAGLQIRKIRVPRRGEIDQ